MPVNRKKKKNSGVGIDFKRAKAKVGKKLPKADNATDTAFTARSIALPNQSLTADKSDQVVTQRNLSLTELLGQSTHYSPKIRKDALSGLVELLQSHPTELHHHASKIIHILAERITDADKPVRATLKDLLSNTVLPILTDNGKDSQAVAPFIPLLMAHTCAAMTHLADPIRADALSFLQMLVDQRADLIAATYMDQVLHHFSDLLSKTSRGRSISAGSLPVLKNIIDGLENFLKKASITTISNSIIDINTGHTNHCCSTMERVAWPSAFSSPSYIKTTALLLNQHDGDVGDGTASTSSLAVVQGSLLSLLVDCWAECGGSNLTSSSSSLLDPLSVDCACALLRCCLMILQQMMTMARGVEATAAGGDQSTTASQRAMINKYERLIAGKVAPFFPVQAPSAQLPAGLTLDQLQAVNIAASQLLTHLMVYKRRVIDENISNNSGSKPQHQQQQLQLQQWEEQLLDWYEGALNRGHFLPNSNSIEERGDEEETHKGDDQKAMPSKKKKKKGSKEDTIHAKPQQSRGEQQAYSCVLQGVEALLPIFSSTTPHHHARQQSLVSAVWSLWYRLPPISSLRKDIIAHIWTTTADKNRTSASDGKEYIQWLEAMPKYIWELKATSPNATRTALYFLLNAARYSPPESTALSTVDTLIVHQLIHPFFMVGSSSNSSGNNGKKIGPAGQLPIDIQHLVIDVLYHCPSRPDQLMQTIADVAQSHVVGGGDGDGADRYNSKRQKADTTSGGEGRRGYVGGLVGHMYNDSVVERFIDAVVYKCDASSPLKVLNLVGQVLMTRRGKGVVAAACRAALTVAEPAAVIQKLAHYYLDIISTTTGTGNDVINNTSNTKVIGDALLAICIAACKEDTDSKGACLSERVANELPTVCVHNLLTVESDGDGGEAVEVACLCAELTSLAPWLLSKMLSCIIAATTSSSLSGGGDNDERRKRCIWGLHYMDAMLTSACTTIQTFLAEGIEAEEGNKNLLEEAFKSCCGLSTHHHSLVENVRLQMSEVIGHLIVIDGSY